MLPNSAQPVLVLGFPFAPLPIEYPMTRVEWAVEEGSRFSTLMERIHAWSLGHRYWTLLEERDQQFQWGPG